MLPASRARPSLAPLRLMFSEPARSTRLSLPILMTSSPSGVVSFMWIVTVKMLEGWGGGWGWVGWGVGVRGLGCSRVRGEAAWLRGGWPRGRAPRLWCRPGPAPTCGCGWSACSAESRRCGACWCRGPAPGRSLRDAEGGEMHVDTGLSTAPRAGFARRLVSTPCGDPPRGRPAAPLPGPPTAPAPAPAPAPATRRTRRVLHHHLLQALHHDAAAVLQQAQPLVLVVRDLRRAAAGARVHPGGPGSWAALDSRGQVGLTFCAPWTLPRPSCASLPQR
jgi:hypothetical protein